MKGGAAGGGYAQVVPMEDINLHFTGDFHAITSAHNLLAALIDNHIYWGNEQNIDARRIVWRRVMDMNDRALREIVCSLGGVANGYPREAGFDITVASEIMAILCLANDVEDLQRRIGDIVVGYRHDKSAVTARDLKADGAMTVLLMKAIQPNLVQTLENNPAFIHGGPFANIAHGCNSVMATKTALKLADYRGDGGGLRRRPRGGKILRHQVPLGRAEALRGGDRRDDPGAEDAWRRGQGGARQAERRGAEEGLRQSRPPYRQRKTVRRAGGGGDQPLHLRHGRGDRGDPGVRPRRTASRRSSASTGRRARRAPRSWRMRWCGWRNPAPRSSPRSTTATCRSGRRSTQIVTRIYRAEEAVADKKIRDQLHAWDKEGYNRFPVCMAKTQYSFSTDPNLRGAPTHHVVPIREVRLSAGAGFVVVICGEIMTMPGLPKVPAAEAIRLDADGQVEGLF